jgi:hypothetical protein
LPRFDLLSFANSLNHGGFRHVHTFRATSSRRFSATPWSLPPLRRAASRPRVETFGASVIEPLERRQLLTAIAGYTRYADGSPELFDNVSASWTGDVEAWYGNNGSLTLNISGIPEHAQLSIGGFLQSATDTAAPDTERFTVKVGGTTTPVVDKAVVNNDVEQ